MKYTTEQLDTIKKGKEYLKTIRTLKRERFHLIEEYNDIPSPHSPSFGENPGSSISQITRMNDYTQKRELLLKKIELFNQYIDQFVLYTVYLSSRQRQIINIYLEASSYQEMLDQLENKYYISVSTYKRELPEICLALSRIIDFDDLPTLDKMNQIFYLKCVKKWCDRGRRNLLWKN